MEEIKGRKKTRMFASFRNEKEMLDRRDDIFKKMPKKHQSDLLLFFGQYESTQAEGFQEEREGNDE